MRLRQSLLRLAAGAVAIGAVGACGGLAQLEKSFDGPVNETARFLLAVALIIFIAHLLGYAARLLRQPPVVGEILGGLLLGPSVLHAALPKVGDWFFTRQVGLSLGMISQLGLAIFMLLLGCELDFAQAHVRGSAAVILVVGSMGLPYAAGVGLALTEHRLIAGAGPAGGCTVAFFGLALSITALPVLARVLYDFNLGQTRAGVMSLAGAAFGDAVVWGSLAVILGLRASAHPLVAMAIITAFVLLTFVWVRPLVAWAVVRWSQRAEGKGQFLPLGLLAGCLCYATITQSLGLDPAVGAFLFGMVVPRRVPAIERIKQQLQGFVIVILLPLYFASVGMSTSITLVGGSASNLVLALTVLLAAFSAKLIGAAGAAGMAGMPGKEALRVGVLMNCRGVTELVVAMIGFQYHLINSLGLAVLVLVALITTVATGPLLGLLGTIQVTSGFAVVPRPSPAATPEPYP
jgi:Kef-type K+ transport system membrane component KefB